MNYFSLYTHSPAYKIGLKAFGSYVGLKGGYAAFYLFACQVWGTLQTIELNMRAVTKEKNTR